MNNIGTIEKCRKFFFNELITNVLKICSLEGDKRIPPTGRQKLNLEVSQKLICLFKVQKNAEITTNLPFSEYNFYDLYRSTFEKSELDRIKRLLPLREMAENFGLVSKSMKPKLGRKAFFTPEGKVALMFLKMYTGLSCPKLMEQLNGNIHYQMFCDVIIDPVAFPKSAICKMNEFGQKTNKKDSLAKELSRLYQSSGGNLSCTRTIAPSTNFPNGKHGQKEMNLLFENHGLKGFISRAETVSLFRQINSCIGIRNSVIHQDVAPTLTHQDVEKHKKIMQDFANLLAVDVETNKSTYYNEH